jgi:hypothetical protein
LLERHLDKRLGHVVKRQRGLIRVWLEHGLVYYPEMPETPESPAALFAAADQLEFQKTRLFRCDGIERALKGIDSFQQRDTRSAAVRVQVRASMKTQALTLQSQAQFCLAPRFVWGSSTSSAEIAICTPTPLKRQGHRHLTPGNGNLFCDHGRQRKAGKKFPNALIFRLKILVFSLTILTSGCIRDRQKISLCG